jgi:hypothetical protein
MILEEENLNLDNFMSYTKKILSREVDVAPEIEKLIKLNSTQLFIDEIKRQIEIQN